MSRVRITRRPGPRPALDRTAGMRLIVGRRPGIGPVSQRFRPRQRRHAGSRAKSSSTASGIACGTGDVGRFSKVGRIGGAGTRTRAARNCTCRCRCGVRFRRPRCVSAREDHPQPDEASCDIVHGRLRHISGDTQPHVRGPFLHTLRLGCVPVVMVGAAWSIRIRRIHRAVPDSARGESALRLVWRRIPGVQVEGSQVALSS